MQFLIIVILGVVLTACGSDGSTGAPGAPGAAGKDGTDGAVGEAGPQGEKGSQGAAGEDARNIINNLINITSSYKKSIVDIQCSLSGGAQVRGTGSIIAGHKILTAHHVVAGVTACNYYNEDVLIGFGGTFYQQGNRDVVIIEPSSMNTTLAVLPVEANYQPKLGEALMLLSFPLNIIYNVQFTFGHVTSESMVNDLDSNNQYWSDAFTTDMVATGGSSGAPVFNEEGKIIAIHVGGYSIDNLDLNYQIPLQ